MAYDGINFLAVLVAAVAGMAVGGIWYMPRVAGTAWMKEMDLSLEDLTDPKPAMIKSFLALIVLAFGMALFMGKLGAMGAVDGAITGLLLCLLIHGAAGFPNYAFENRTVKHFAIHLGNSAIAMTVMGAIIATWTR